jgi:hypothetical protein
MNEFTHLRQLADLLDLNFGVAARKSMLEGNEKLTPTTDAAAWTRYFSTVLMRLNSSHDTEKRLQVIQKCDFLQHLPDDETRSHG